MLPNKASYVMTGIYSCASMNQGLDTSHPRTGTKHAHNAQTFRSWTVIATTAKHCQSANPSWAVQPWAVALCVLYTS